MTDTGPRPDPQGEELTDAQRAGLEVHQADQDRTLAAAHRLEAALSAAATGREAPWRDDVARTLAELDAAAADEQRNAAEPDSLLADISRTQPRLRNRVRGLRLSYQQLRDRIAALASDVAHQGEDIDVDDLRRRIAWLLTAVRHQRARESDLIYEAYYEAFHRDLTADNNASEP